MEEELRNSSGADSEQVQVDAADFFDLNDTGFTIQRGDGIELDEEGDA